ncbi:hypothetical protein SPILM97S_00226 [Streptomyces pilosus]
MTEKIQTPTPRDAFELLMAGNQRFISGTSEHPNQDAARRSNPSPCCSRVPTPGWPPRASSTAT